MTDRSLNLALLIVGGFLTCAIAVATHSQYRLIDTLLTMHTEQSNRHENWIRMKERELCVLLMSGEARDRFRANVGQTTWTIECKYLEAVPD